jgi:xylan 1,4-beta-xylosidase
MNIKNINILFVLFLATFINGFAQSTGSDSQTNKAYFDYLEYKGNDAFFKKEINTKQQYLNPIIAGFYPDPSICRKGDDYYMVTSCFGYYPGIPIWHSKDLGSWKQMGRILDRSSQLNRTGLELSEGMFAPTIRYNEANNTFYAICTVVSGIKNFIVKTTDLSKGWSEPILLPKVRGINPSIFFEDNGKAFITNGVSPMASKYRGYKDIWLYDYDTKADKLIDAGKKITEGGIDSTKNSVWLKGPHIYKVNNNYYLICAEVGTGQEHNEAVFESDKIDGDYSPCEINPIMTPIDLADNRPDNFTSTGHG